MPYSLPPRWAHRDTNVEASEMNKYSDALNWLYTQLFGDNPAAEKIDTGEEAHIVNVWRWLHYMSITGETATIEDPAGVQDDITLSDSDSSMAVHDLSNTWITAGALYRVTGAKYLAEDWQP